MGIDHLAGETAMATTDYAPARGCELLLNSWCDRHCLHSEAHGPLLARFDILRRRAQIAGQLMIGFEGLSFLLLRACRVTDTQLQLILQHYGMSYPATAAQLTHSSCGASAT